MTAAAAVVVVVGGGLVEVSVVVGTMTQLHGAVVVVMVSNVVLLFQSVLVVQLDVYRNDVGVGGIGGG